MLVREKNPFVRHKHTMHDNIVMDLR